MPTRFGRGYGLITSEVAQAWDMPGKQILRQELLLLFHKLPEVEIRCEMKRKVVAGANHDSSKAGSVSAHKRKSPEAPSLVSQ